MSSLLAKVRRSLLRHASECFALSTFDHCLFRPAASHSRDGDDDRLAEPLTLESFPATVEGVDGEKERSRSDRAGGPGKVFEKGCAAEALRVTSVRFANQKMPPLAPVALVTRLVDDTQHASFVFSPALSMCWGCANTVNA
jgi:hypothetical protein